MGERDWQSSEPEYHDRFAGIKATLARIFGDGENPFAWGFKVGTIGNLPIRIHLLFLVYLLVELIFTLPGNREGFVFVFPRVIAMLALVLARELVHMHIAKRAGGTPIEIMLWPMGGLIPPEPPEGWKQRVFMSFSPVLFNLVLLPAFAVPLYLLTKDWQSLVFNPLTLRGADSVIMLPDGTTSWWLAALGAAHAVNLVLIVIVMLPMYPMEGARILDGFLSKTRTDHRAQWLSVHVGLGAATVIGIFALVMKDATALFALCVICGIICSMHRRRLQFLATADMIPGLSGSSFLDSDDGSENNRGGGDVPSGVDQDEVDRILLKISEQGIGALTRKERRTLKRATETSRQSQ
jgi:Zn-dependent protease